MYPVGASNVESMNHFTPASQYQVHPNQVGTWKRQAIEGLVEVFSKSAERRVRDHESEVRDLHANIGELIVERDPLSRGSGR